MTPNRDSEFPVDIIVDALEAVWSSLAGLAASFTDADWQQPTRLPGWSVQDTLSHLIGTELLLAGRPTPSPDPASSASPAPDAPEAPHLRNDIGRFNEISVEARRTVSGPDVLAEFSAITDERLAALRAMRQLEFDEEAWTPAGRATYGRFMQIRVFDSWMHEQDIRDAVGRPGHVDGPAVDRSLDEISLALGYVVGKAAAAPRGSSVAFVVTGPTHRRFDIVVEDRARLSTVANLAPTVTLTTDLPTFIAVVGGRADAPAEMAAGRVALVGDVALGQRIIEHLAFVI